MGEILHFAFEHLTQKFFAHAYLVFVRQSGRIEFWEFTMRFLDLDESLSNILHALAAVPFGLAFFVVAIRFLAHAA